MDVSSKLLGNKPMNQREACKGLIGHQEGTSSHQWKDFVFALTALLTFENVLLYSSSDHILTWIYENDFKLLFCSLDYSHINILLFKHRYLFISCRCCPVSWATYTTNEPDFLPWLRATWSGLVLSKARMVTFSGTQHQIQSQQTEVIHCFSPKGKKVFEILIFIAEGEDWLGFGQSHQGEN